MAYATTGDDGNVKMIQDDEAQPDNPIWARLNPPADGFDSGLPDDGGPTTHDPGTPYNPYFPYPGGFGAPLHGRGDTFNEPRAEHPTPDTSPSLTAEGQVLNDEARLRAAGQPIPEIHDPNLFERGLDLLNRPGAAGREFVSSLLSGKGLGEAWSNASQGFQGKTDVPVDQLASQVENANLPVVSGVATGLSRSGLGRFIEEFGLGVLTDPTSYIGIGAVGKAGKAVEATGFAKKLEQGVEDFVRDPALVKQLDLERQAADAAKFVEKYQPFHEAADTAARGAESIVGQHVSSLEDIKNQIADLGATRPEIAPQLHDLRMAEAQVTDTLRSATDYAAAARNDADTYGSLISQAQAAAKAALEEAKQQTPRAFITGGAEPNAYLKVAGVPLLNVEPIKTALGATITRVPGVTQVQDALGRIFVYNYTPTNIVGEVRNKMVEAKNAIEQAAIQAASGRRLAQNTAIEELSAFPKAVREAPQVAGSIEKTAMGEGATATQLHIAQIAQDKFAADAQKMLDNNIPLRTIDNYFFHMYKDDAAEVEQKLSAWRASRAQQAKVVGAEPGFLKSRSYPTLEEAIAAGLHPETDPALLTSVHAAATAQAVTLNNLGRVLRGFGPDLVSESRPGANWISGDVLGIPTLKGTYLHPELGYALANIAPILSNSEAGVRTVSNLYNSFVGAWKAVQLFTPQFHMRNAAGNVWLNALDGMVNPARYAQGLAVLLSNPGKSGLQYVELNGRVTPVGLVKRWAEQFEILGTGAYRTELNQYRLTQSAAKAIEAADRQGLGKLAYYTTHPFETSMEFGSFTDSLGRMANFLHHLDLGQSVPDAANATRKALFDYQRLTPTEQVIRRNFVPFYAWMRNNMPHMAEALVSSPGMFTGSAHVRDAFVNINNVDERHLPDYLREQQAIPIWTDASGNIFYLNLSLPFTDLSRIHDPRDLRSWGQEILKASNPFISGATQIATNTNLLTGHPITKSPEIQDKALADYGNFLIGEFLGAGGRFIAGNEYQATRERMLALQAEKGKTPDQPEVPHAPPGIAISIQNPAANAARDVYAQRDLLQQALQAAAERGIRVPTTVELKKSEQRKEVESGNGPFSKPVNGPKSETQIQVGPNTGKGFGAPIGPRAEAPNVPTVVSTALKDATQYANADPSWGPYLTLLMNRESNGRTAAVNPTPVRNTWTTPGQPFDEHATGLFQMLPSTFRAWAVPGHTDIYNAYDNTLAAIRYISSRYGHPSRIPGLTDPRPGIYTGY